jgi:phosphoribosylcarboxyaminoimidazole (NCAIR) mutase
MAQTVTFLEVPDTSEANVSAFTKEGILYMTEVLSAIRVPNRLSQFVHQPLETLILIRALIP